MGANGSFILDSLTRGLLNTNELDSKIAYNNSDYSYESNLLQYDGTPTITATGSSSLGLLTSSAQSITQIVISAESSLGAISSLSTSSVEHFVEGSTNLGELLGEANTTPTILPIFNATLDGLTSVASAAIQIQANAIATLGSLSAISQSIPEVDITAQASLGSLVALAQSSTPEPPTPDTPKYGSNGYIPIKKKQKKERPTPVIVPEIVDLPELPSLIKSVFAGGSSNIGELYAFAENRIDFSILRDEQELMMLL